MDKAIIAVFAKQDTLDLIALSLSAVAIVAIMENVLLLTHVNASEEEWERIVKSTAAVEDMEAANQIKLVSAIQDSFSIQLQKNVNFLAMVRIVINAMAQT